MTAVPALAAVTTEVDETERWIYSRLSSSAALTALVGDRVFPYIAPPQTAYPLVTFGWQGDHDVQTLDGSTVWVEAVYTLKAIGQGGSEQALGPVAAAVHFALHGHAGPTPSGNGLVISCLRDSSLTLSEVTGGRQYRTAGGLYRIRTQLVGT